MTHKESNPQLSSSPLSQVSSQTSSVSSCEDYIIILPDCFDTSRPLGESMYSSAVSQPDASKAATSAEWGILEDRDQDSVPELCWTAPQGERQERTDEADEDEADEADADSSESAVPPPAPPISSSVNQMLCASQTLDAVTLTPEVVLPPPLYSPRLAHSNEASQGRRKFLRSL